MAADALVDFAGELRTEGLPVGTGAVEDFCRAVALLGPAELYWAGRVTLVGRQEEIPVYDRVFGSFFGGVAAPERGPREEVRIAAPELDSSGEGDGDHDAPSVTLASRVELLRHKRFEDCTDEEVAELARLAAGFARALPRRRPRRRRPSPAGSFDLPRTLRRSLRTGGEPFDRRYRARRPVTRRLVLLVDVSGSMAPYSRALLVLAHAIRREHARTELLCFGTRLTPATRALVARDPDEALRRVAAEVADWEGGTRIGESLKAFLDGEGHRSTARGSIVVIYSDGLDVGEPELLRAQMARLARLAHRVVWLNPLKQDPAYEPLARGMAAALPYVDVFASAHTLASLEDAARMG